MKNRKKAKTLQTESQTSKSNFCPSESRYIPPEVLTQVLAYLPAKTLVRFKCVCKFWCSIIDHPDFASMHLKQNSVNCDKNKNILVLKRSESKRDTWWSLTVRQANTLRIISQVFRIPRVIGHYGIRGSCNGLLLVRQYGLYGEFLQFQVWNPCIRKKLILPTLPHPPYVIVGQKDIFGFAPDSKEYKVVAIDFERCEVEEMTKMHVAVYTLSDKQWTVRNDGLNTDFSYLEYLLRHSQSNAVYFQGEAHWLGNDQVEDFKQRTKSTHIVSFNFDTEKFSFSELPFASAERDSSSVLFLYGNSLAIFSISAVCSSVRVLEKGEWTLRFSGSSSKDGYKLFCKWSVEYIWKNAFYYESDGDGHLICGKISYNIATCQMQKLTQSKSLYFAPEIYSESLVLLKGYGAKDLKI